MGVNQSHQTPDEMTSNPTEIKALTNSPGDSWRQFSFKKRPNLSNDDHSFVSCPAGTSNSSAKDEHWSPLRKKSKKVKHLSIKFIYFRFHFV